MRYYLCHTDGRYTRFDKGSPSLTEMQELLGGLIEAIPAVTVPVDLTMFVCEQPVDDQMRNSLVDYLTGIEAVGPVLIFGLPDADGDLTDCPTKYSKFIEGWQELHREVHLRAVADEAIHAAVDREATKGMN